MEILSKIWIICCIAFIIGLILLFIVDSKMPREAIKPIEEREPNYIINGEKVYCSMMSRNVFGTGVELNGCSNGRQYYNVQNVIRI